MIRKGVPVYISGPNAISSRQGSTENSVVNATTSVLSTAPTDKFAFDNRTKKIPKGATEVFLHIKLKPISSRIEKIDIIGLEELNEQREISDDLLNIYLPLCKEDDTGIYSRSEIKTNFLFLPDNSDRALSFYFDSGQLHHTAYMEIVTKRSGSEAKYDQSLKKKNFISAKEGDYLYLLVEGDLSGEKPEIEGIPFDKIFELKKLEFLLTQKPDSVELGVHQHEYDDLPREGFEERKGSYQAELKTIYPLGFIEKGNFIHARKPSSLSIFPNQSSFRYFAQPTDDDDGCPVPKFTNRDVHFISVR
jgi:hypothetical protein